MDKKRIENQDRFSFTLAVLIVVLLSALALGYYQYKQKNIETPYALPVIDELACHASGGAWNACGSLCRGSDNKLCASICVGQCECSSDQDCPFGSACQKMIENKGICAPIIQSLDRK